MPAHPNATARSIVVVGSVTPSNLYGHRVTCPLPSLPEWDTVVFAGIALSNDDLVYDPTKFVHFRYATKLILSWAIKPSNRTYNLRPLDTQPQVLITDKFGYILHDVNKTFEVAITTKPVSTSISNAQATVERSTGIASFYGLTISGPQREVFTICMQASAPGVLTDQVCDVSMDVALCPDLLSHGVELDRACVCDIGYQFNVQGHCELCPLNKYRANISDISCSDCPYLHFTNSTGSTSFDDCKCRQGFISDGEGNCKCAGGTEFIGQTLSCDQCRPGFYKDSNSLDACIPCKEFEMSPFGSTGRVNCSCTAGFTRQIAGDLESPCVCDAGYFYNPSLSVCWRCPIASYKTNINSSYSCEECKNGFVETKDMGSTSPHDCVCLSSFVKQVPTDPLSKCVCDLGYWFDFKSQICSRCDMGKYKDKRDLYNCTVCDWGTSTRELGATSISDCMCDPGFYSEDGHYPCGTCPVGGDCPGLNIPPTAMPGYYSTGDASFIRCSAGCLGNNMCEKGYSGDLCSSCEDGYYRSALSCYPCGSIYDGQFLQYYAIALVAVLPIIAFLSYLPPAMSKETVVVVFISFMQTMGLFVNTNMTMPGMIESIVNIGAFANGNALDAAIQCTYRWDSIDLIDIKMVIPILWFLALALLYPLHMAWNWTMDKLYIRMIMNPVLVFGCLVRAFTSVMMIYYLPLTASIMEFFDCIEVEDGSVRLQRLRSEVCYTGRHMGAMPKVMIGVLLYVIGLPLVVTFICKTKLKNQNNEKARVFFGSLSSKYGEKFYSWEVFIMSRKFFSVCCFVLLSTRPALMSLFVVCLCYMSTAASYRYKPYVIEPLNTADVFGYSVIMFLVVIGLGKFTDSEGTFASSIVIITTIITVSAALYALYWSPHSDEVEFEGIAKPEFVTEMEKASVIVDEPTTLEDLIKFGALFEAEYADLPDLN